MADSEILSHLSKCLGEDLSDGVGCVIADARGFPYITSIASFLSAEMFAPNGLLIQPIDPALLATKHDLEYTWGTSVVTAKASIQTSLGTVLQACEVVTSFLHEQRSVMERISADEAEFHHKWEITRQKWKSLGVGDVVDYSHPYVLVAYGELCKM